VEVRQGGECNATATPSRCLFHVKKWCLYDTFRVVIPPHKPCHSVSHLDTVTPSPFTSPSVL
jgi:hypothetical protein